MRTWKKIAIGGGVAVLVAAGVSISVYESRKNIVTVQTARAQRLDLVSIVSASGEIKPKTYVNIGANAFGKITKLYVKEGERVKKGQLLAQLENVQSSADVSATKASLQAAQTDAVAADAALNTSLADLNRAKSDYEREQLDWNRAQGLYKEALIAKSEYDSRHAAWQTADAGLAQAQARVAQAKAQKDSAERHIAQMSANHAIKRRCVGCLLEHVRSVCQISAHLRDVTFSRIFLCLSLRHSRLRLRQSRVCGLPRRMAAVVLRFGDQSFFIKSFRPIPIKLLAFVIRFRPVQVRQRCVDSRVGRDSIRLRRLQRCFGGAHIGRRLHVFQLRQQLPFLYPVAFLHVQLGDFSESVAADVY